MPEALATGRFFEYGLDLHRSLTDLCTQLEREGWRVHCLRGTRLRYWCACDRQHQIWIDTASPLVSERLEYQLRASCFTFTEGP